MGTRIAAQICMKCVNVIHFNQFISWNNSATSKHNASISTRKLALMITVVSISAVFIIPHDAFSITSNSNGTVTTSGSSALTSSNNTVTTNTSSTTNSVSNQVANNTQTNINTTPGPSSSLSATNSTSNPSLTHPTNSSLSSTNSTSSKPSTSSTLPSTNSTSNPSLAHPTNSSLSSTNSSSMTGTVQNSQANTVTTTTQTGTITPTSNSTTTSTSPPTQTSQVQTPTVTTPSSIPSNSTTSTNSQPTVLPSIVVSGVNGSIINSSEISSPTVYTGAPILPPALSLTNDQSYYAYGDVVTFRAVLPGLSLQNISMVVEDPTGNDIVSRTVTTNENGTAELQFKIPSNFETGNYNSTATATVEGKSYTNMTNFNVIKTHGISIDSLQLIDQQGNPSSMIKKGQNNFVKISISSGETMPALFALNLFDANQTSIGTASVNSTLKPGDTQMTLSFFIPPSAQVGTSNILADAFSNWPSDGGTPLTTEVCLSASLEDPAALPASYQSTSPQTCTIHPQNFTGTTLLSNQYKMTNDQALVTLGVAIQNDSMTFMSPTQAQLLALAYQNGTASSGAKSISLVSLNLNQLNSTISNTTGTGNVTQFTTLVGPALQNDPMAQKILQEIQISKHQIANIIGNETATTINDQLIQQQRVAAVSQLKQDLTTLAQSNAANTPSAAYSSFLATIPNNKTQQVFAGEFNFMQQRVAAANAAMQNVLDNGGSWDQAIATFNNYAAINHAQIVQMNNNLNVMYGLANSNVQSCFDSNGDLTVVNGTNPCLANLENNSTSSTGIRILSVQATDQNRNPVSTFTRGQSGYVELSIYSSYSVPSLVTINLFDSNLNTLGISSAKYTLNPGTSQLLLPFYIPSQSQTGLASIYANVLTDWPNKGGTSQTHELSYFVGLL